MKAYWKMTYRTPKLGPDTKTACIVADTEDEARKLLENEFGGFTVEIEPGAVRLEMSDQEYEAGI